MRTRKRKTTRRTTIRPSPQGRSQRGVALVLVLWTFAAVAVLAAEFARAMHDEAAATRNYKEGTEARMVAAAGIHEAILALRAWRGLADGGVPGEEEAGGLGDDAPDPVRALAWADSQWVEASFRGHRYELRVTDEAGKVGLNAVDATLLRTILNNLEVPPEQAEVIADSVIDWRDADDLHQPNGAETEYYQGLERPYRAKNDAFDSVEELLLVRGVTREVFFGHDGIPGLRDIFTVFNGTRTVNMPSVTPAVMLALAGIQGDVASDYLKARRGSGRDATIEELRGLMAGSGAGARNTTPQQLTIEARVRDAEGRAVLAHVGAVVSLAGDGDGLRLFRWYDSIFDDSDQPGGNAPAEGEAG